MKKLIVLFVLFLTLMGGALRADEGMWIPMFIDRMNYEDMQKLGLKLSAEEIYSINNACLKDAIVIFGRGCTGEIVSKDGLLLTNHHCGYGQIQTHSSIEHDYLKDGFWAMSREEELPNPGLTVQFLVRIEDVTEAALNGVTTSMDEQQRSAKITENGDAMVKQATEGTIYNASVRGFFGGNQYFLFVYKTYKDVRLVGAPPSSIGKFGADTDNWMWPRHTCDFSMFRVYSGKDGEPADYSKDNVPYQPAYYLPVSLDGYEKDDFAMILGYPGSTDRYLTSPGVDLAINTTNPSVVKIRQEKLDIMMEDMTASDEVRIKYASKYARISNYWKYYIGQTKGLKRLKVYDKKLATENEFAAWAGATPERTQVYGTVISDIGTAYETVAEYALAGVYHREAGLRGAEITSFAWIFKPLAEELSTKKPDQEKVKNMLARLKEQTYAFFKDYNLPTDRKLLAKMMEMFYTDVDASQQPPYLREIYSKYKGDFTEYSAYVFSKSVFTNIDKVKALLDKPSAKVILNDPAFLNYQAFDKKYNELGEKTVAANSALGKANRLYIAGLMEMYPDRKFYPNANSTMRLTYGTIQDYYPADAVHYDYYTTLTGVMTKEDPNNWEFVVPSKLKDLYKNKDFGRYGENGELKTCFTTNHDITGGNSGSPVINAEGQLIGLAFDGNWEAMSGDIAYEPELQRTICVDIRYVLFIIDKYAGARHLVDEMTIVKSTNIPELEQGKSSLSPIDATIETTK
jgi:V8-like Glu-specific endopeptidase